MKIMMSVIFAVVLLLNADPALAGETQPLPTVPEPATLLLLGTGLAAVGVLRYRRKQ